MPSALPPGDPSPRDGTLPEQALAAAGRSPFSVYVHIPFCRVRCGYCDFNTYTLSSMAELGTGASPQTYADTAIAEVRLARRVLGDAEMPVQTVFFGGGTPTLLAARDLGRILRAVVEEFGLAPDAEVTVEANPESVDAGYLHDLRAEGATRLSIGMQSARPHVLALLDRQHTPGRPEQRVAEARAAGFAHVNLDLIYGTPGESDDDWRASLEAALGAGPDHVSAYALIVEEGTRLAARIRRGEMAAPDDDVLADRYLIAEQMLQAAGLRWYEVSNWATGVDARSRHNLAYWRSDDWWGIGPGAHSHVGGVRWWNVKHPVAYAGRLAAGESPAHAREVLDPHSRHVERVLLEIRLVDGVALAELSRAARAAAQRYAESGLLDREAHAAGRAVLTLRGRLLADAVARDLTD